MKTMGYRLYRCCCLIPLSGIPASDVDDVSDAGTCLVNHGTIVPDYAHIGQVGHIHLACELCHISTAPQVYPRKPHLCICKQ